MRQPPTWAHEGAGRAEADKFTTSDLPAEKVPRLSLGTKAIQRGPNGRVFKCETSKQTRGRICSPRARLKNPRDDRAGGASKRENASL